MSYAEERPFTRTITRPIVEFDETVEQPPTLRPSIDIRVEYRQVGPGPESVEVQWDAGTTTPSATDICQVIAALLHPYEREPE